MNTRIRSPLERSSEAFANLFRQLDQVWIQPELARRRQAGTIPVDFKIKKCMVYLGSLMNPSVFFNEEFGWQVYIVPDFKGEPVIGMNMHYSEIKDIESVQRPLLNGKPTSFIYLSHSMSGYSIIADIIPEGITESEEETRWKNKVTPIIIDSIKETISERLIMHYNHTNLRRIGLWLVPSLFPYPLSKIFDLLSHEKIDDAQQLLTQHCNGPFLEHLASEWLSVPAYRTRQGLLESALWAHREKHYDLSIHATLPHVEGIISDFLHSQLPSNMVPFRPDSKIKKFKDVLLGAMSRKSLYAESVRSSVDFMLDVMLEDFKKWFDPVHQRQFPMRHPVMHGRYDSSLYSEENSVKLFLMLDTLHSYMSLYSQLEPPHDIASGLSNGP